MSRKRISLIIFLGICISLFLISSTLYYISASKAKETIREIGVFTGKEEARYNYLARLKPNTIYNVTIIKNSENVYTRLLQNISVNFRYSSSFDTPGNITIDYYYIIELVSSGKWVKTIYRGPKNNLTSYGQDASISMEIEIDPREYFAIAKEISMETGTAQGKIILRILPVINLEFTDENANKLKNNMEPMFQVTFAKDSEKGEITIFEGFRYERETPVYKKTVETNDRANRYALLYISFMVFSLGGVFSTGYLYKKSFGLPRITRKFGASHLEKIFRENEDLIVKSKDNLNALGRASKLIRVASISDMVRVSEILDKPIMYYAGFNEHIFAIVDGEVVYQYVLESGEQD